jgi:hypothetical protein
MCISANWPVDGGGWVSDRESGFVCRECALSIRQRGVLPRLRCGLAAEDLIESLLALHRYGFTPTEMTLPSEQWDALNDALGPLSSARWGTEFIRFSGPGGVVDIWKQRP